MTKTPFKVGDRVAFQNKNVAYTVTVAEFISDTVFRGENPIYTKGQEYSTRREYVTQYFTPVKKYKRDSKGRFLGAKPAKTEPFTEESIEIGAKYVNTRHQGREYFGVSLAGEKKMLLLTSDDGREFHSCNTSDHNPVFWEAFKKI